MNNGMNWVCGECEGYVLCGGCSRSAVCKDRLICKS